MSMLIAPVTLSTREIVHERLRTNFGADPEQPYDPANVYLQDKVYNRQLRNLVTVVDQGEIIAVGWLGSLTVLAGSEKAATKIYEKMRYNRWDIILGDYALAKAVEDKFVNRLFFKVPVHGRKQLLLYVTKQTYRKPVTPEDIIIRPANVHDLDDLAIMAAQLHVDDQMGDPMRAEAVHVLKNYYSAAILRRESFVIEHNGVVVGKTDVSIQNDRFGSQIVGVFVKRDQRGKGYGKLVVAGVIEHLFAQGTPLINLHVRAGNTPAEATYGNLGFTHGRTWRMSLNFD